MKVHFNNPPINELIIGVHFQPPLARLRSEHIGLLWSRFRTEFPTVEQRPPLFNVVRDQNAVIEVSDEFMVMPRFWLVSEDETRLIQIDKGAFLLNWRRRNSEYPHFADNLKPAFDKYYSVFRDFLENEVGVADPKVNHCELTYVDVIPSTDYWQGPHETHHVIPSFVVPDYRADHDSVSAFNCKYQYDVEPNLQLHVAIRTAETVSPPALPLLFLEFKALGRPDDDSTSKIDAWYDQAHDVIISRFLGMTSKDIQRRHWELEEVG